MFAQDVEAKNICGRKLRVVERGLDEADVSAVIASLVEQNDELARKQESLQSVGRHIERVLQKAQDEANDVRIEAERRAKTRTAAIVWIPIETLI